MIASYSRKKRTFSEMVHDDTVDGTTCDHHNDGGTDKRIKYDSPLLSMRTMEEEMERLIEHHALMHTMKMEECQQDVFTLNQQIHHLKSEMMRQKQSYDGLQRHTVRLRDEYVALTQQLLRQRTEIRQKTDVIHTLRQQLNVCASQYASLRDTIYNMTGHYPTP